MGAKTVTENDFRDTLVFQIIEKCGRHKRDEPELECRVKHGSKMFGVTQKARCQYCWLQGEQSGRSGGVLIVNSILPCARRWTVIAMPCGIYHALMKREISG